MVSFVLKHWIVTLFIPPLAFFLYTFFTGDSISFDLDFWYFIVGTILLSAPTYIFMFAVGYFVDKEERSVFQKKLILFIISLLGILISFQVFIGDVYNYFTLFYSILSLLSVLIFKSDRQNLSK